MSLDCTGVYGLHMSPSCGRLRATQNLWKTKNAKKTFFFTHNVGKSEKTVPKRRPKG